MEKYADDQYVVTKREGKLILRMPGGEEIPYDGRLGNISISEGESVIIPKEN